MIDGYDRKGKNPWKLAFHDKNIFLEKMKTNLVKGWADKIISNTQIIDLAPTVQLIIYAVHPWPNP